MMAKIRFKTTTMSLAFEPLIILLYYLHTEQVHRLNYCPSCKLTDTQDKKGGDQKETLGKLHVEFFSCQNTIFCAAGDFILTLLSFAF
jgi:hypothetical protein